ncbi:ferrous iron transport protein B [Parvularcula sp. IMCC14364]|uniref:ferrous iron transport protein B n=1 Tax=Parvularcula sp. IMCC14364 TaxID=3067902 RepID=UPI00274095FA|nr:ferrous iron transport protein B [Parvularcula sp. IMCC14364]
MTTVIEKISTDQAAPLKKSDNFTIALVGAPNCGKSTLFNGLTGGRAKVANYTGVTVETKQGTFSTPQGRGMSLLDLPGIYGLSGRTTDAKVALDVIKGQAEEMAQPDAMLVVIDAAQLRTHLQTALQMRQIGLPMIVVLNMYDLAQRDGVELDVAKLQERIGVPVIPCTATRKAGREALLKAIDILAAAPETPQPEAEVSLQQVQQEARQLFKDVIVQEPALNKMTRRLDGIFLHPLTGGLIFIGIMFVMFQAVFSWSETPMGWIEGLISLLSEGVTAATLDNWLRSLLVDGVIAGVGSVIIFLPQIIVLFLFILFLEMTGYMARAAFMMDELMLRVGLNGRAFIPLLSSFACAIPGMMAARTLESEKDRLTTIMVAPLMTCSARLPVYTVIIAAFFPSETVAGFLNLQGLVMFGLYVAGIISAIIVAFVLRKTLTKGQAQPLLMELPTYKFPDLSELLLGLWQRAKIFLRRAGTIIFVVSVALWVLTTYPGDSLETSFAGMIGSVLLPIFEPIGFNLEIVIALVPGLAAREVAVGALGTVYAVQGAEENIDGLASVLRNAWSLPTALSFLAWYVFAPQCISTIAVARREMNSWAWTWLMVAYLFALAYIAAGGTYWIATALL